MFNLYFYATLDETKSPVLINYISHKSRNIRLCCKRNAISFRLSNRLETAILNDNAYVMQ